MTWHQHGFYALADHNTAGVRLLRSGWTEHGGSQTSQAYQWGQFCTQWRPALAGVGMSGDSCYQAAQSLAGEVYLVM